MREKKIKAHTDFPLVGVGASAGGLDAFKKLIKAIPEDSGMAVVLVQHLSPGHESLLPEILQKVTKIPVLEISDDIKVEPDHIYVIPSNKMLEANDGVLQLSPRVKDKPIRNQIIDIFFASLGEVYQSKAVGVVLSGTASDETEGLKRIKEYGGITFAQDEDSAAYEDMPRNAVQAGVVDFVLHPEKIPEKILEITGNILSYAGEEPTPRDEELFKQIITLLRHRSGTDFTFYKHSTIQRRILRRMALSNSENLRAYLKLLKENRNEQDTLYQDCLISVTSFFRDTKSFIHLKEIIIPQIIKGKTAGDPFRFWVAGCSTGEEAYSIAICMKEILDELPVKIQIFATDLSEPAINKARSGIYTKRDIENISPERLQQFFTKLDGSYQVNKNIRDLCVFAQHNFLKDPPFGKIDLISCRNVLIYFDHHLQKKALTTFHYSLKPKGILMLGKSETTSNASDLFTLATKSDKFFIRKDVPATFIQVASQRREEDITHFAARDLPRNSFLKIADEIVLNKYTPAGVVINEAMDILHFRGDTSKYLQQTSGKPSHNLIKMAKNGLAFELRNILYKVKRDKSTISKENIPLNINGSIHPISIEAIPLPNTIEPYYLILFIDQFITGKPGETNIEQGFQDENDERNLRIIQLEQELAQAREDMRSITEDQETVNEELQSANEELLSSSEELQSLNEELETGKEELQSTNEELVVVNQEMSALMDQVKYEKEYAQSIVETIRDPLLVLDKNLKVKSGNNSFYKTFRLNEAETEGRLIYEISGRQWDIPELRSLLDKLIFEKSKFNDIEIKQTFGGIGERVLLINANEIQTQHSDNLILLSIEDVTERKGLEFQEKKLAGKFKNLLLQTPVAIVLYRGPNYIVELVNDMAVGLILKSKDDLGKPYFESMPEIENEIKPIFDRVLEEGTPFKAKDFELQTFRNGTGQKGFFNLFFEPIRDDNGNISGLIGTAVDVTDQVLARKRIEIQNELFREMLMSAPGFVATLYGPDHIFDLVNQQFQNLFGKREIKNKPILEALPELEGQGFDKILDKVYETGDPYIGINVKMMLARDEGLAPEERYFNFSYQPMYDEQRRIFSILKFGYEVTEQVTAAKRIEKEQREHNKKLKAKNDELEKLNQELKSFAYVSSHDLQEPLRKIQTFASRIFEKESDNLSEEGKDYFRRMQLAARRMQTLIEDLLTFSRVSTTERNLVDTDLNDIIEEVKENFKEKMEEKGAIIETLDTCKCKVIPFQLRQLIENLLSNSLKFVKPDAFPHIKIKCNIVNSDDLNVKNLIPHQDYCHIIFEDNGIGFEPHFQETVFGVFQRLHERDEYMGTGIGLAIVKKIAENHHGFVSATSELGKGARFDVYLPSN